MIRKILNISFRKKRESPSHIFFHNGKSLKDSQEIANAFNEYFISIGPSLANTIKGNDHYSKYLKYPTVSRLKLEPIDESKTRKLIEHLKNKTSTGIDGILVLVYTQEGSLWSIVLRCDDHTGIFTCDGCARDPYFYVPAETQSYVIKLSCSRKVLAASGD